MKRLSLVLILFVFFLTACDTDGEFEEIETPPEAPGKTAVPDPTIPPTTEEESSPDTTEPVTSPPPIAAVGDKWSLWVNGPHLRGANIWQAIVIPELDGPDFKGPGPVGPPYSQEDFNRLAASIRDSISNAVSKGAFPAIVTNSQRRRFLTTVLSAKGIRNPVISYEEIDPTERPSILGVA